MELSKEELQELYYTLSSCDYEPMLTDFEIEAMETLLNKIWEYIIKE